MAEIGEGENSGKIPILTRSEIQEQKQPIRRRKQRVANVIACLQLFTISVGSFLLFDDRGLNMLGDGPKARDPLAMRANGWKKKGEDFQTRSPEYQFIQDFITGSAYKVRSEDPGSGLQELTRQGHLERIWEFFGSDCLADTSYDPRRDDDPTRAAEVNPVDGDVLSINPVNPDLLG